MSYDVAYYDACELKSLQLD